MCSAFAYVTQDIIYPAVTLADPMHMDYFFFSRISKFKKNYAFFIDDRQIMNAKNIRHIWQNFISSLFFVFGSVLSNAKMVWIFARFLSPSVSYPSIRRVKVLATFLSEITGLGVFQNNLASFSFHLFGSIRRSKKLRPKLMLEKYFTEEIVQLGLYERPWMTKSKLSKPLIFYLNFCIYINSSILRWKTVNFSDEIYVM